MEYPFRNLVFEGGGVKGIAYVGALEILEEHKILKSIKRVGGTSAGAIVALLVGLGYSPCEIEQKLKEVDLKSFMDSDKGIFRDYFRIVSDGHGWCKGNKILKWIEERIEEKGFDKDITFGEIKEYSLKETFFQGTNLSTYRVETFSPQHPECKEMKIKDAVRISMSIPLLFAAVKMNNCFYVDGGLLSNYPVRLFDRQKYVEQFSSEIPLYTQFNESENFRHNDYIFNLETLGFRLDPKSNISIYSGQALPKKEHKIESLFDFTWSIVATLMETQNNVHLSSNDSERTVYIDTLDVSTIDFEITKEKQNELIQSGREGTIRYLEKYKKDVFWR
ncbi:patatin-like phospholipase family protein [Bacillus inaquosorum]|uniref:patatin-like phospholipase family protein n=1 Tax=Bacillus inaquosorum TaxID=483913 RepID=UPI00227FE0B1|nr:patatin-like phospholipase family protein [Bacillus inaquosorum]MCY7909563.1 patatin-like phospholipase family protein [Bacillus inaquosorum]MCY8863058.1 patatin-like phospholipase family protein [Bacillus inaquosorum]MCY8879358.1 patatin-like phospholipase family protein [Bacillus inaquosorum]